MCDVGVIAATAADPSVTGVLVKPSKELLGDPRVEVVSGSVSCVGTSGTMGGKGILGGSRISGSVSCVGTSGTMGGKGGGRASGSGVCGRVCSVGAACIREINIQNEDEYLSSAMLTDMYMGGLILGVNTFFKLFPMVGKGLTDTLNQRGHFQWDRN